MLQAHMQDAHVGAQVVGGPAGFQEGPVPVGQQLLQLALRGGAARQAGAQADVQGKRLQPGR